MPRIEHFTSSGGTLRIKAQRTDQGWIFYAWRPGTSQAFTDGPSLLRWAKWPAKTPTGDALRQWLSSLEEAPATIKESLTVAGSWDPAATLDESDPNHQTRTIV